MFQLADYTVTHKIYESPKTIVYEGYRTEDKYPFIFKMLPSEYPEPKRVAQFHHEYEITRGLNLPGIINSYGVQKYQNHWVLILENIQGETLNKLIATNSIDLVTFLHIAIRLAESLNELHANNIIHKDIKPSNIIVNLETGQVKITDFSISSRLSLENQTISNPNLLEGTLLYMSPEQTGRMNRSLDYRTDFYSLGVVCYEMLIGYPPFQSTDAMELVHCHLAKSPPTPHSLEPSIPKVLSDIVMKLLAKTAESRYQSGYGIKADLQICLQQLQTTGEIGDFVCGQQDISDRFQIPQKIYGRDREIEILLTCFDRVTTPAVEGTRRATEMLLVSGYSGIGKSMLIQEIYKPITPQRGYFISGKFDQFRRNIPYSAIVSAFTDLIRQLLTETESQLALWQEQLLAALGNNGQVIIDVIPEVELIIGEQPAVPQLIPVETQNRFNQVFQKFIHVFCQPEHPLVIFLDDLQWVDAASLKLIELLMTDKQIQYLFMVGAYRDNEVNPTHPLVRTLEELYKIGVIITEIVLAPLSQQHVMQLIADTLPSHTESVTDLAELVMTKTNGNPFFINQFLKTLYQENLITFQMHQAGVSGSWRWNLEQIKAMDITDNVVDLMIGKLKKLPVETQQVLRLAACVGNRFDLDTLSIIHEKTAASIYQILISAIQEGLILPTSGLEAAAEVDPELKSQLLIRNYKFLHDRVQQAAYALIDDEQKRAVHLKIGQLLLANTSSEERDDKLFTLVDHLNIGRILITVESEQVELIQLNLEAAQKAKDATAYAAALQYLIKAFSFLEVERFQDRLWTQHYELALALYKEKAEVDYLNGHFEQSEAVIHQAVARAKTPIEQAEIYHMLIVQYTLRAKYAEAIQTGRQALSLINIDLPEDDFEAARDREMAEAKETIGERSIASLFDLPTMSQPEKQTAVKLLITMGPPCYRSHQRLWAVIVPKVINLCLKYGNVPQIGYSHTAYGGLLGYVWNDYKTGTEFGELAHRLMKEKFHNPSDQSVFYLMIGSSLRHWSKPLKYATQDYHEAYNVGLESGNLQYAAYAFGHNMYCRFYQGINLNELLKEIEGYLSFSRTRKNQWAIDLLEGGQRIILNLMEANLPQSALPNGLSEAEYLDNCEAHKNIQTICIYYILKTQLLYLLGQPSQALECYSAAETRIISVATQGLLPSAEQVFNHSLILVALYPQVDTVQQPQYWKQLESNQQQLKIWAENCPENFLHKYLLIEAEMARLSDDALTAIDLYDQAIESAAENKFIQHQALGNELAAQFWLTKDKEKIAKAYLVEAHYGYKLWGANRKVLDLEEKYPHWLLIQTRAKMEVGDTAMTGTNTLIGTVQNNLHHSFTATRTSSVTDSPLDLTTIMKASQAISSEIVLANLIKKFMHIVIENVGAQKGWLILRNRGFEISELEHSKGLDEWFIEAHATLDEVEVLEKSIPLTSMDKNNSAAIVLPQTIIAYCIRTQMPVVLDDAAREELFVNDAYVLQQQPKSVLCFPIIYKNQLIGLFYLENNLTTGVFTSNRLAVLKLLSTQIAISLENAQTMATLDAKVLERTAQLNAKMEELIQTRNELVQSEKMASLGRLVAGFAHEINTPIGVAVSAATTLQDNTKVITQLLEQEEVDEDELVSTLEHVEQAANLTLSNLRRTAGLVSSFKRTAIDQSSDQVRHFHVKAVIEDVINTLHNHFRKTTINIQVDCPDELAVYSLPGILEQILTNLMMNSLVHGFEEGQLTGQIRIAVQLSEEILHLEYSDTGKGIEPETLEKIFEPFFTTHRTHGGSGLGLYICYNLITSQLQGNITCESSLGKGVTFKIHYPIQKTLVMGNG